MGAPKLIVSVDEDWGIGKDGSLLVRNPRDMAFFKDHTMGKTVIAGRTTLEGLPGGRPLKGRRTIVLSRDPGYAVEGAETAHSVEEALRLAGDDAWVIGGGEIYREFLPYADVCIVTRHHCVRGADTRFPDLSADEAWEVTETLGSGTTAEGIPYEFLRYERKADHGHLRAE